MSASASATNLSHENNPFYKGTLNRRGGEHIIEDQTTETASTAESTQVEQPEVQADSQEATEPVQPDNSETSTGSEEQDAESFFDPNTVPDELKPAYKQMQAAFTKKTQEIASARKETETLKEKAERFDRYAQYIPVLDEMMAGKDRAQQQESPEMTALAEKLRGAGYSEEAIEMMKLGSDFILNQFKQTQSIEKQNEFINTRIQEASKLDPRLNDQNLVYDIDGEKLTFGQIVEDLVAADAKWMKDPLAATQRAIKKVDALIGKAKTEGKQELSAKAKAQSNKFPQVSSSPQSALDTSQPLSIDDAFKQAKQELGL